MSEHEKRIAEARAARIVAAKAQYARLMVVITVAIEGGGIAETARRLNCSRKTAWELRAFLGLQSGRGNNQHQAKAKRLGSRRALLEVRP